MALDDPIAMYSTLPTVEVDGMSYPVLSANIVALRMREALGGLSVLELTVADWVGRADGTSGFGSDSGSPLKLGAGLRVFMGPAEIGAGEIFDGQVIAVECETRPDGPPLLTVIAEDRLFAPRRKRRSRSFENVSAVDIARTIASDHGLTPEIRSSFAPPAGNWTQQDETDLGFLRRVLTRFDGDVQVVGARMQVGKVAMDQRTGLTLTAGGTLERVRIVADLAHQVTEAKLASFDPGTGKTVGSTANAQGNGPGHGKTGAEVLNEKFATVAGPLGRYAPTTQSEADAVAQADYDRQARGFVRATGTAIGTAQLRVGSWVTIEGVNPQFVNEYAVCEAVHRFDPQHGYRTDFVAECAYFGGTL
jgi:phage protein D